MEDPFLDEACFPLVRRLTLAFGALLLLARFSNPEGQETWIPWLVVTLPWIGQMDELVVLVGVVFFAQLYTVFATGTRDRRSESSDEEDSDDESDEESDEDSEEESDEDSDEESDEDSKEESDDANHDSDKGSEEANEASGKRT